MRQMISTLVRALAALAALALVAAACGGGSDESGRDEPDGDVGIDCPVDALDSAEHPVEVDVWHTEIGLPSQTLHKIVEAYHAAQDKVRVTLNWQGTYQEQLKKYEDTLRNPADLPSIVIPDDTVTQYMADSGSVVPASACLEADPDARAIYDDMVPIVPAAYTIDGTLWPAAYSAAGAATYFNIDHFNAAGVDPAQRIETLADLRAVAEQIQAAAIPGVEAPIVWRIESWPLEFWTSGVEEPIVNENNGRDALATEALYANDTTLEIYRWLAEMKADGLIKVMPYADVIAPFLAMANQSASFLIDTSTAISTVNAVLEGTLTPDQVGLDSDLDLSGFHIPDLNIGVGGLPGLEAYGKGQMGGGAWYIVNSQDPAEIAAAWDFLKFFNDTEQQVTWAMEAAYFPVRESAVEDPRLESLWNDTRAGQWMRTAYETFATLDPDFPGPVIGPYNEFRFSVINGLERLLPGGEDPETVMESVNDQLQASLDAYAADVGA